MRLPFASLLREPRPPGAPARVWRDWALVAGVVGGSVLELVLRDDVAWPLVAFAAALVVTWPVLIRRQQPLLAVAVAFTLSPTLSMVGVLAGVGPVGLYSMAGVLPVLYSLMRWGSGREISRGLLVVLYAWVVGSVAEGQTLGDVIGGLVFLAVVLEAGALVRMQVMSRREAMNQVRSAEREQIARELHDTVAHHVSAIAVQAQAGRAVGPKDPEMALHTLAVIEEAASRTLAEMRTMVGTLRGEDARDVPLLAPQRTVRDIPSLAGALDGGGPQVTVEIEGEVDALRPSVGTALYRLAQESVTNALKHAQHATQVLVHVDAAAHEVRLTVSDDGAVASRGLGSGDGYGLVGMAERAHLLGGTLRAGPHPDGRGWRVDVVIPSGPRSGAPG